MAGFNGKWKLVSSENGEAFFNAVNASDDFKTQLRALATEYKANPGVYVEEIKVDKAANTIQRIVYVKGEVKKDSGVAHFGEEAEGKCHGKPAKLKVVLESDTKIVRTETGADFSSTSTLELNGNSLILTLVGGGVTAVDKYERV
jgi:hypothetical protein